MRFAQRRKLTNMPCLQQYGFNWTRKSSLHLLREAPLNGGSPLDETLSNLFPPSHPLYTSVGHNSDDDTVVEYDDEYLREYADLLGVAPNEVSGFVDYFDDPFNSGPFDSLDEDEDAPGPKKGKKSDKERKAARGGRKGGKGKNDFCDTEAPVYDIESPFPGLADEISGTNLAGATSRGRDIQRMFEHCARQLESVRAVLHAHCATCRAHEHNASHSPSCH